MVKIGEALFILMLDLALQYLDDVAELVEVAARVSKADSNMLDMHSNELL